MCTGMHFQTESATVNVTAICEAADSVVRTANLSPEEVRLVQFGQGTSPRLRSLHSGVACFKGESRPCVRNRRMV